MALTRTLYRSLTRVAQLYDANPQFKAFLRRPAASSLPEAADVGNVTAVSKVVQWQLTNAYFRGFRYYMPEASMVDFIAQAFRTPMVLSDEDGADVTVPAAALQDAAIDFLGRLQKVVSVAGEATRQHSGLTLPSLDEVELDLQLLPPERLRTGCMLVEHPALAAPGRGLSIITDTQQEATAICVNRPIPVTVNTVFDVSGPLGDNPVFVGGSENTSDLFVMHPYAELEGAAPLGHNLFVGCNLKEATALIEEGKAERTDFKFVAGRDVFPMEVPGNPMLPPHFFAVDGPGVSLLALLPSLNASSTEGSEGEFGVMLHSVATWGHVCRKLGGEYDAFARVPPQAMSAFNAAVSEDMDGADIENAMAAADEAASLGGAVALGDTDDGDSTPGGVQQ